MTEAMENQNETYRREIVRLIGLTEDTHILKCVYTAALTHIQIENERKAAKNEEKAE